MLRSNYNVTKQTLLSVIFDVFDLFSICEHICAAKDGFENGLFGVMDYEKIVANEESVLRALLSCDENYDAVGFFDEDLSFYLRASLEPHENINLEAGEEQSGIFELYACDADIERIFSALDEKYDLFLIKEGSKKRLLDISL